MALVASLVFATWVFYILFHIFQLLINFTEGTNIMGFLPPQLPHVTSFILQFFTAHSSFRTIIHLAIGFSSFHTFPWVPARGLGTKKKHLKHSEPALWYMGSAFPSSLPEAVWQKSFSWSELLKLHCPSVELQSCIAAEDLVAFSSCLFLQLLKWSGDLY